ncbi:MAG: SDR family oxidoreductase [Gammaproteobacteria bacterium]
MLKGKKILVTGATSGIGRQIAITMASLGAHVIISGRSSERANSLQKEIGSNSEVALLDITSREDVMHLVSDIDVLDGIVHSAGINQILPVGLFTEEHINNLFRVNYSAPLLLTQQLVKKRKIMQNSSIVFISSIMSIVGNEGNTIYAGTKAALVGSMQCMALELAKRQIRVNCVSPGFIRTEMTDDKIKVNVDEITKQISLHPLGEGKPSDVASMCAFLCSDHTRWITGQNIVIDGGYCAR